MEPRWSFLASFRFETSERHAVGKSHAGMREVVPFVRGMFVGPKIKARLVSGGSDAPLVRRDGAVQSDARCVIRTDDGAVIYITYRGIRHASRRVMQRLARGENVEPDEYYLRTAVFFETGSKKYAWLNRIIAVGIGRKGKGRIVYDIYEVL